MNGEVCDSEENSAGNDYTQWEVVRDHVHPMYYFRTNQNQSIRAIDLKRIDFSGKTKYKHIPLSTGKHYEDVTL